MDSDGDRTAARQNREDGGCERDSAINMEEALAHAAGDPEMLASLARLFLEEGPKQLQDVANQLEQRDLPGVREAAHKLKGSLVIFAAEKAESAAKNLEALAEQGDDHGISDAWAELKREMMRLTKELEALCGESND